MIIEMNKTQAALVRRAITDFLMMNSNCVEDLELKELSKVQDEISAKFKRLLMEEM